MERSEIRDRAFVTNLAPIIAGQSSPDFGSPRANARCPYIWATRTSSMRRHVIYGGSGHFRLFAEDVNFTDVTYGISAGDVTYADGRRKLLTTEVWIGDKSISYLAK
jgi:hypothetical protein